MSLSEITLKNVTQHYDYQQNGTWHNNNQHNDGQHNEIQHNDNQSIHIQHKVFNLVSHFSPMISVIML